MDLKKKLQLGLFLGLFIPYCFLLGFGMAKTWLSALWAIHLVYSALAYWNHSILWSKKLLFGTHEVD